MVYTHFARDYDRMMHDVDYAGWAEYLCSFLEEHENVGSVLDCACGTGNITLALANRGYAVTGLDLSSDMLNTAQEKARNAGLRIPFICQDMRDIALHHAVDAVVCVCDGINYLRGEADLLQFLASANRTLRSGGLLLFDLSSEYKLRCVLGDKPYFEDSDSYTYLWTNRYHDKTHDCELSLTVFSRETGSRLYRRYDETHIQHAFLQAEIECALKESGFSLLGVFDAFTRNAPTETTLRIQFVCRKD